MRTLLVVGVFAATLVGCSRQPPLVTATAPCTDMRVCHTAVAAPAASPSPRRHRVKVMVAHRRRSHDYAAQATAENSIAVAAKDTSRVPAVPPHAPATTVADPHPVTSRTIQQQVAAAAAVAEKMSTPDIKQSDVASAEAATATPAGKTDALMVVLMARRDIKSLSELNGKNIAIDDRYSASNNSVRTAIAAAGALEVQLTQGRTTAIDRLVNGEAPAAVLALVSVGAADSFPEIAGYKTFHIPLSPRALNRQP